MEEGGLIVDYRSEDCKSSQVGGKAYNLWRLGKSLLEDCQVPAWFCLTTQAFDLFLQVCDIYHGGSLLMLAKYGLRA